MKEKKEILVLNIGNTMKNEKNLIKCLEKAWKLDPGRMKHIKYIVGVDTEDKVAKIFVYAKCKGFSYDLDSKRVSFNLTSATSLDVIEINKKIDGRSLKYIQSGLYL